MSSILQKIKTLSSANHEAVLQDRQHIHANPELSFEETNTANYVVEKLKEIGLQPKEGVGGKGVVVSIKGKDPDSKTVALRADMDALPIQEMNDVPYKSKNPGVMHACGHDVHTSSLLGTAKILDAVKSDFTGTIKLIFQPAEEKLPGGASLMIKDGVLKNPTPTSIVGQHVMPLLPAGTVGFRSGKYMASTDEIYMTVKGKGGHGAMPDTLTDSVLIAAHIIVALQQVVSRVASPKMPSVLSFGKVTANGATNIIPDEVKLEGTFRTLDEKWRSEAHSKIKKMATGIAESMGAFCEIEIVRGYPVLFNNPRLTQSARKAAEEYMGKENVHELDIWMAAEDFAYYSHEVDACFYRLGIRNESKGITSSVHTATFNIDEDVLAFSPGLMAWIAICELSN